MTYDEGFADGMRRAAEMCHRLAESYTRSVEHYAEDDPERRKIKWGAAAVTVAEENILAAIPASPTAQCCMCGKRGLSTAEDGGPECELHDGRWVCSSECYDRAIPPAAPWTPPPEAERAGSLYLIFKAGRGFYRPEARGYTMNTLDAGRYTLAEAVERTYPNGPDGPRDGLVYMPAPEAKP